MRNPRVHLFFLITILIASPVLHAQQPADAAAVLDKLFERWNSRETPGGAVAVSRDGKIILSKAYGMADLEHGVPNTPETIFEAGSVSKQFTSGAIVMLALQGKLSVNDNIRKYVPEVPDYGTPITIRHLMTHTSGLRDWGSVAGMAGWPRTTRVHTHAHVLDILSRQSALNFPPGNEYSYSNSGYNLLAIIVDRVSGMPFAEFTKKFLFEPIGMSSTEWRDDFKRIVKNRSVAYNSQRQGSGFEMNMPFEDVHGNGGLLTTVGDLLLWTENLETGKVGGPAFLEMMHRQGRLNSGAVIEYASGLFVTSYRDIPEVSHSGSTAGYRAFLARYPQQHLAVAVLANVGSVNTGNVAHTAAELFLQLPPPPKRNYPVKPVALPEDQLASKAGMYHSAVTWEPLRLMFAEGALRMQRGGALVPVSGTEFRVGNSDRILVFEAPRGSGRARFRDTRGGAEGDLYEPVADYAPKAAELAEFEGEYYSPDAEAAVTAVVENGMLVLRRRPDSRIALTPAYADVFESSLGLIRFIRDAAGRITQFSARQARVYDMRFHRVAQ